MKIWLPIGLGVVLFLMGGIWTLQGLGYVGGSFMSGARQWFWIGLVTLLAGLALVALGLRARGRQVR